MQTDSVAPRSRRSLLVAGLGGIAATVASALGRPSAVRAGSDGDVVLGSANTTSGATTIASNGNNLTGALSVTATGTISGAIYGHSDEYIGVFGGSTSGIGVQAQSASTYAMFAYTEAATALFADCQYGNAPALIGQSEGDHTGVYGYSGVGTLPPASAKAGVVGIANQDYSSIGVLGESAAGYGVEGLSTSGVGVIASTESSTVAAGRGYSPNNGTGLHGQSGYAPDNTAPAKTGVYGAAAQDGTARGVYGKTTAGRGVYGEATNGQGVRGYSASGAALYGSTSTGKAGYALRTVGRVRFDKSAGIATITSGTRSVVVTPGIDLASTSAVVATLQGNPGGTTTVQRVAIDTSTDKFTIYLTANSTATVTVAWHVFG